MRVISGSVKIFHGTTFIGWRKFTMLNVVGVREGVTVKCYWTVYGDQMPQ